jgi:hypothetical protein
MLNIHAISDDFLIYFNFQIVSNRENEKWETFSYRLVESDVALILVDILL